MVFVCEDPIARRAEGPRGLRHNVQVLLRHRLLRQAHGSGAFPTGQGMIRRWIERAPIRHETLPGTWFSSSLMPSVSRKETE
jgi:hypothetical protein